MLAVLRHALLQSDQYRPARVPYYSNRTGVLLPVLTCTFASYYSNCTDARSCGTTRWAIAKTWLDDRIKAKIGLYGAEKTVTFDPALSNA